MDQFLSLEHSVCSPGLTHLERICCVLIKRILYYTVVSNILIVYNLKNSIYSSQFSLPLPPDQLCFLFPFLLPLFFFFFLWNPNSQLLGWVDLFF